MKMKNRRMREQEFILQEEAMKLLSIPIQIFCSMLFNSSRNFLFWCSDPEVIGKQSTIIFRDYWE